MYRVGREFFLVDILVHYVIPNEEESDKMDVYFAASKSFIIFANQGNQEKTLELLRKICVSTLKTIELPDEVDDRFEI